METPYGEITFEALECCKDCPEQKLQVTGLNLFLRKTNPGRVEQRVCAPLHTEGRATRPRATLFLLGGMDDG